jgi:hypothetical protein
VAVSARRRDSRRLLVAGVALIVLLAGVMVARGQVTGAAPGCRSTLIPAYVQPATVAELVRSSAHPRTIILNPSSGPGSARDGDWARTVELAHKRGSTVIGYVHTTYGARPAAEVRADIDRYREWYGVDGIFLDETAHTADKLAYYRSLMAYVHGREGEKVTLNPGIVPARGYFDDADVVVTFEGAVGDLDRALGGAPAWLAEIPREKIAHLVYGADAAQMRKVVADDDGAAQLYVTNGTLPDPWQAFAPYLADEEQRLAACG